jgi:exonuclease III
VVKRAVSLGVEMRIISLNTNGIRAAHKKGLIPWMQRQKADVICIQETKAQIDQLVPGITHPKGFHSYFCDAEKKGYSGVAIYSRQEPDQVIYGCGWPQIDREGRVIRADFGKLSVISLYLPSGSSKEERQIFKYEVMDKFYKLMDERRGSRFHYLRRLEYRPQKHRPEKLARQPKEFGISARRTRVDGQSLRRTQVGRCLSRSQSS